MSLSDFESDLTDLSSDEEEYIPVQQKKKAPAKGKNDYKVQNALRPPRTTQYTAKSLYDQVVDGTINLEPEYQRDVVWPDTKQIGLVDSILRNYYIPPVIFAVIAQDDGTEKRTCIDGKQRLTSIQRFMDGLICHKDSLTNKRYWYKDAPGPRRTLLPKQYMQAFANKQITCVEYDCLTDDQEREIFQRVQLGVALTPAERMQANTGPRSSLIREVQTKVLGEEGFANDLDWGHTRGRDYQCLASIVYIIDHHPSQTFPGAGQLDKWLQATGPVKAKFRTEIMDTFKIFNVLVKDKRYNAAFQKPTRVSPIEFTMIGVLIAVHKDRLSMMQLSSAIWKMRADVRSKHADIRANTKVTRTMFAFISKGLKSVDLKSDGKGDSPATSTINSMSEPAKKVQKRKRPVISSEEEEQEEVQRRPPQPRDSTSYIAATGPAETAKLRQASQAKSVAKKATKPPASRSVANVKESAKQSPIFPPAKQPGEVASAADSTAQLTPPCQVSSQEHVVDKGATPLATPSSTGCAQFSTPRNTSSSAAITSIPPTPLALPRRSPNRTAFTAEPPVPDTQLSIKNEPDLVAPRTPETAPIPPIDTTISSPLAPLRSVKARGSSNAPTPASPIVTTHSTTHASMDPDPKYPEVLDGLVSIVKRERPEWPSLNTSISSIQEPSISQPEQTLTSTSTLPAGTQINQASIERILAMHGIGQNNTHQTLWQSNGHPPPQPDPGESQTSVLSPHSRPSIGHHDHPNGGPSTLDTLSSTLPTNTTTSEQSNAHARVQAPFHHSAAPQFSLAAMPPSTSSNSRITGTAFTRSSQVTENDGPMPIRMHGNDAVNSRLSESVSPSVPARSDQLIVIQRSNRARIPAGPRAMSAIITDAHPLPMPPQPQAQPTPTPSLPAPPLMATSAMTDSSTTAKPMSTSPVERTYGSGAVYARSSSGSVNGHEHGHRWTEWDGERDRNWPRERQGDRDRYRDRDRDRDSGWRSRGYGERDRRDSRDWDRDYERRRIGDYRTRW